MPAAAVPLLCLIRACVDLALEGNEMATLPWTTRINGQQAAGTGSLPQNSKNSVVPRGTASGLRHTAISRSSLRGSDDIGGDGRGGGGWEPVLATGVVVVGCGMEALRRWS
jgi:hypothetical protein